MTDKPKIVAAVLAVIAGFAGFFYFSNKPGYVQLAVLLVPAIIALVLFLQTAPGKATREFARGSYIELRKVVWPTQKETMQVTLVVFVMAVLVAVFLWAIDWSLHKIVKAITG